MDSASLRTIAVFGLASGLCLALSGLPGGATRGEQAPDQVAKNATRPVQGQPAGRQPPSDGRVKPPTGQELKALLSRLLDGIRENDSEAVSACLDTDRMLVEMEGQRVASVPTPGDKTALRVALKMVVGDGLLKEGAAGGWKDFRVHRVGADAVGATSIFIHVVSKEGRIVGLVQFWLTRDAKGDWKIFDWQEASSVFKTSTMVAVTVSAFREDPGSASLQRLAAAAKAAAEGDMEASERIVLELANDRLPDALEAPRWLLYAQIKYSQGQPEKSLECLEQAAKYDPDMVALPKIKALIYGELKNSARSLEFANQALKALGDDAEAYSLIGNALAQLGRAGEAAAAYRKGLDADPNLVANLVGLAGVLPGGKKEEVAARLSRCADPADTFLALAEALVASGDKETLARITDGTMKLAVDDSVIDYYRARSASLGGQMATAVKLLKSAITRANSDDAKRYYGDQLLDLQLEAGHSLDAYQDSVEPEYAFTYLAQKLSEAESADQLLTLATSHVNRVPTSPEGFFYRGRALLLKKQYEEAGKAFAEGIVITKSPPQRESFRSNLVLALYKAEKGLAAYQEVGPHRATLEQLAGLYLGEQQADPLLKLVAAARKDDPENP
ncbi:MAG TPA: tetratricopeptide repeat protein, partial [Isosphaeraceae bacterium]|nr:tetratricopeptide repeat protein [Isosphaeraceae bacterium]